MTDVMASWPESEVGSLESVLKSATNMVFMEMLTMSQEMRIATNSLKAIQHWESLQMTLWITARASDVGSLP